MSQWFIDRKYSIFTWREYDKEVWLYFNRARYYDAGLGRFVSRDPIGMRDNVNLYTYVANSPVKYVDRMGLEKALILIGSDKTMLGFSAWILDKGAYLEYQELLKAWYKSSNIIVHSIQDIDDINKYITEMKYKDISIVAHSNSNVIGLDYNYTSNNQLITKDNVEQLSKINDKDVTLTIIWCLAWAWEHPIAENIANAIWVTVKASTSILDVSGDTFMNWGYLEVPQFSLDSFYQTFDMLINSAPAHFNTFYPSN